ncbi:MAG: cbb3-type cytochrome c oxidase subunit 3 [Sterolibacterium sp.]|jgi:cytochrome c oxidase cbb3-type subunit 4|nr:cbb3-type cytochrome c oxidase subunit 3 [Sterolibacterium sp.]
MDSNDMRVIFTVVTFVTFIGIVWWAYSSRRQKDFDEAAMLPFTEDEPAGGASTPSRHQ